MDNDPSELPAISDPAHRWGVAESDCNGSRLFIRFNRTAKQWIGHADLAIKIGFAIPLHSRGGHAPPDPDGNDALHAVEDVIIRNVEAQTKGLHALTLTTDMMKELVFYIPWGVDIPALHDTIQQSVTTHDVQCTAVHEPDWDAYRQFVPI